MVVLLTIPEAARALTLAQDLIDLAVKEGRVETVEISGVKYIRSGERIRKVNNGTDCRSYAFHIKGDESYPVPPEVERTERYLVDIIHQK